MRLRGFRFTAKSAEQQDQFLVNTVLCPLTKGPNSEKLSQAIGITDGTYTNQGGSCVTGDVA